jgi:LPS export ABC transporter protein LptC
MGLFCLGRRMGARVFSGECMMVFPQKLAKGIILAVALGLASVLVYGIIKGRMQQKPEEVVQTDPSAAEMKLTDMEYTELKEGKRLWTLWAAEAQYFQDEQKTMLKSVNIVFFLEDGEEVRMESQEGILYAGTKNIELWNSIRALLPDGYELLTEKAFYNHERKSIASETLIKLKGPDVQLQGNRWEFRIPEREATLEGDVRASLIPGTSDAQHVQ